MNYTFADLKNEQDDEMTANFSDFRPISATLLQPAVATVVAFVGVGIGVGLRRIALHSLSLLVAAAMGVLLAVTIFDVLPDAKQLLAWPTLLLACASGIFIAVGNR